MNIVTDKYELMGKKRIKRRGKRMQVATLRQRYCNDRLYAWTGTHTAPTWEKIQDSTETEVEFLSNL